MEKINLLCQIQSRLVALKGQFNSFGKYKYRNLEDIYVGLKPLLKELNCSVTVSDDLVMIGDRYYIKATASLLDENNEVVASNVGFARESLSKKGMDEAQITGTASSYARKYALGGLFAIDDNQDVDSMDNSTHTQNNTAQNKKSSLEVLEETIKNMSNEDNLRDNWIVHFKDKYKVDTLTKLNDVQSKDCLAELGIK